MRVNAVNLIIDANAELARRPLGRGGVSFHDPVQWDGWIRYHHESSYVGAGMSYVRGQVLTEDGRLVASFTQDAMIRAFTPNGSATSVPLESRL